MKFNILTFLSSNLQNIKLHFSALFCFLCLNPLAEPHHNHPCSQQNFNKCIKLNPLFYFWLSSDFRKFCVFRPVFRMLFVYVNHPIFAEKLDFEKPNGVFGQCSFRRLPAQTVASCHAKQLTGTQRIRRTNDKHKILVSR